MRRRAHIGCGTRNPFGRRVLWTAWTAAQLITWPLVLLMHTWLGFAGWLPWLAAVAAALRWEYVHSPERMYRTWFP
jgi:hypothetical protein